MATNPAIRVGLLGVQSNRNLGDTATFSAAIAAYRRRVLDITLIVVVPEPRESARLLGTAGFPLYGNGEFVTDGAACGHVESTRNRPAAEGRLAAVRRVYSFAGTLDAIVFTGGGLLDDFWGGPWNLPFWVLVWVVAARLQGVRVSFHGIGLDRLSTRCSRRMAVSALRLAHYRSVRDDESRRMLVDLGLERPCEVIPDLAFAFGSGRPDTRGEKAESAPYVILNPVSERMWTHGHDGSYAEYLQTFVDLSCWLLDRGLGVKLLSTQDKMDAPALTHVAAKLRSEDRSNWECCRVTQLDQFLELARHARLVASSRLHGLILALVVGTPVVSVAPMRKMTRVMYEVGLADFNIDIAGLQREVLITMVDRALTEEARLRSQIATTVNGYRRRLNASFDQMVANGLLGLVACRVSSGVGGLEMGEEDEDAN